MAITAIGGAGNSSGTTNVTTISVTYSPTAGNAVVMFTSFSNAPAALTVQDNLGNNLFQGPSRAGLQIAFFQFPVPSGVTGYTLSWTGGAAVGVVLEEYSGVVGVGSGTSLSTTGTSASVTSNVYAGDYVILGFLTNPATATSGTIRQTHTYFSTGQVGIADNTSGSAGNVTVTVTFASATYAWCSLILSAQGNTNGATVNSGQTNVTSLKINFSPTVGGAVCIFLTTSAGAGAPSVHDNLGNALTAGPTASSSQWSFYQFPVPSGVTSYTATWTGSMQAAMVLQQYPNASSVSNGSFQAPGAAGTSASATSSVNAGGYLVTAFTAPYPETVTSGVLEVGATYFNGNPGGEVGVVDNLALTTGNVTCSVTFSSAIFAWVSLIIGPPTKITEVLSDNLNNWQDAIQTNLAAGGIRQPRVFVVT